jgi:hypothetical protein
MSPNKKQKVETKAHILSAVTGNVVDVIKPVRALISVSDKTGIVELGEFPFRLLSSH